VKVVVLANLRWVVYCPSWYRLASEHTPPVDLLYNGLDWYLTNGENTVVVPDRDTGAMMLAKKLNEIAARGGQGA
jgi:hypothetical protein